MDDVVERRPLAVRNSLLGSGCRLFANFAVLGGLALLLLFPTEDGHMMQTMLRQLKDDPKHDLTAIVVGAAVALLFLVFLVVELRTLFDRRPIISIDERGILDERWKCERIPWAEVLDAYAFNMRNMPVVSLKLRDPDRFTRHLSWGLKVEANAAKRSGFGEIAMSTVGLSVDNRALAKAIRAWLPDPPVHTSPVSWIEPP